MLNCFMVEEQVRERQADLHRERHTSARAPDKRRRRLTARQRLGWSLVEFGLRLTVAGHDHRTESTIPAPRKRD